MRTLTHPSIAVSAILAGLSMLPGVSTAADFDRTKPPQTPPVPDIKLPNVVRWQLKNGLTIVAAEDRRFPLMTVRVAFNAGSKFDPKDLPGLADNVAALLNQGTASRSAKQIAEEAADLGGQISGSVSADVLTLAGSCLSENAPQFLKILGDVARNASFPEDEVALQKQNRLQNLRTDRSSADYVGREALHATLFGPHPYSRIGPTENALTLLDRKALVTFRDSYLVPNNAYLIMVGRLPEKDDLTELIEKQFGSWERKDLPAYQAAPVPQNKKQFVIVDRPGSVQANVYSAHISPTYGSATFFPLVVGTRILGGGTNSRLFMDIREKRSFAYDAHSQADLMKETGAVMAVTEVRNEVVGPAIQALNDDLAAMAKENVDALELTNAKSAYAGTFILRLESQVGLANQLERVQTMDLPADYLDTYMTHVRSVEPDQIRQTGKYWAPEDATLVIVGDAQKIQKPLEKFGTVQVIKPIK